MIFPRWLFVFAVTAPLVSASGCEATSTPQSPAVPPQPFARHAVVSPNAARGDLLYVSAGTAVNVYSWRSFTQVATLTGFSSADGMCVDGAQNVWIVDGQLRYAFEYAHGGSTAIKSLAVPGGWPDACAVDPTTGNLAVVVAYAPGSRFHDKTGGVEIYPGASAPPTEYQARGIFFYDQAGYDASGDLFVNGVQSAGKVTRLAELPAGSTILEPIKLNVTLPVPSGGVQWDGKYLALGDGGGTIYRFVVSGRNATKVGATMLAHVAHPFAFFIAKLGNARVVVAADQNDLDVPEWRYPAGGQPLRSVSINYPGGVVISRGRK